MIARQAGDLKVATVFLVLLQLGMLVQKPNQIVKGAEGQRGDPRTHDVGSRHGVVRVAGQLKANDFPSLVLVKIRLNHLARPT